MYKYLIAIILSAVTVYAKSCLTPILVVMQEIAQKCSLDLDSIGVGGVLATDVCAGLLECGIFLPGCSHGVGLQPWWEKRAAD